MNVSHLRYFITLAKYEHYGKAAQTLHITQPSLSKAIRSLEEELGVFLFEKEGRGVRITKQGKRYLSYATEALSQLDMGSRLLQKEISVTEGYLDIGLITSIANWEFSKWISSFQKKEGVHPYLSLRVDTSTNLVRDLCEGRYDLIFCTEIPSFSQVEFAPVLEQSLACIVPTNHPFAERPFVDIKDLDGQDFITHTPDSQMFAIGFSLINQAGIHVRHVAEASEDRSILGLVSTGLGISIMTISPEVYGEGFRSIPLTGTSFHRYVSMGWLKNKARPEMAERFRRFVLHQADSIQDTRG